MKSCRSSSTFITVDLLFHKLLPFVQNSFSGLFFSLLSHIWMKVGRKLPYEELQIKFDFRHGWLTFSWVIALCLQFSFHTFLGYDFTFLIHDSWYQAILTVIYWKVQGNNGCWFKFGGGGGRWGTCIALAILSVCLFQFGQVLLTLTKTLRLI